MNCCLVTGEMCVDKVVIYNQKTVRLYFILKFTGCSVRLVSCVRRSNGLGLDNRQMDRYSTQADWPTKQVKFLTSERHDIKNGLGKLANQEAAGGGNEEQVRM